MKAAVLKELKSPLVIEDIPQVIGIIFPEEFVQGDPVSVIQADDDEFGNSQPMCAALTRGQSSSMTANQAVSRLRPL